MPTNGDCSQDIDASSSLTGAAASAGKGDVSGWQGEVFLTDAGEAAESSGITRRKSMVVGISGTVSRFLGGNPSSVRNSS